MPSEGIRWIIGLQVFVFLHLVPSQPISQAEGNKSYSLKKRRREIWA